MFESNRNIKCFILNDNGKRVLLKQPKPEELTPLYFVLLNNLTKINKSKIAKR